ncbi:MAG: 23S rRNA (guanosine(2251)-2'-O)-methyltransferase RlmB [Chitinophagales bacterium]|nr:23S rRNA (guanosine(2251)-2'-O)-methyltransferase RlmB [Chitinophagales bacterium]MCZ2392568.1 23S rRNA (guanosine(2251)-2'-O)-methyltransferase RlmB [Chitinophagales bacterium]
MSDTPYVVGRQPVLEALEAEEKIDKVFISKFAKGEVIDKIKSICRQKEIHYQIVPEEKLQREWKNINHQGVAAVLSVIKYYELQELIDNVLDATELPFFIILDGVTDVRNIGAIARTAYGLGVHGIILPQKGSAPIQADAIKSSAGALLKMPICRVQNLVAAVKDLKLNGIEVIGIHAHTDIMISEIRGDAPLALVMGAEDAGISAQVQKEIQTFYKIPISNLDSYNVSVAAALTMYQVYMNRQNF